MLQKHFGRVGLNRPPLDAAFQYQVTVLRELVLRLEGVLEDEGVPAETRERVIRCMVYGTPSAADAELRAEQQEEMAGLLAAAPPGPLSFPPRRPDDGNNSQ
jgi:hypothetical protein